MKGNPYSYINQSLVGANFSDKYLWEAYFMGSDLREARFTESNLKHANFTGANLSGAFFTRAKMEGSFLDNVDLTKATLIETRLGTARITGSKLIGANLLGANFEMANLSGSDFSGANLEKTTFIKTNLHNTIFDGCRVYGISAWDLEGLESAKQSDLIVTPEDEPPVTVDNLLMAQDIYKCLRNNREIGKSIETWKDKAVVIFGSFQTNDRKATLESIKNKLRHNTKNNYLPIVFDFKPPHNQPYILETSSTLSRLSRYVIIDLTAVTKDSFWTTRELVSTAGGVSSVPIVPIVLEGSEIWPVFWELKKRYADRILDPITYKNVDNLINSFEEKVIMPAEAKVNELRSRA